MQNLRKQSRLCTHGSACGREQALVYTVPDTNALSAKADTSQPSSPFNTGGTVSLGTSHRSPEDPMSHNQSREQSGSLSSSPFCPTKRGRARKTSSANFWNSFLIKDFGFAKPMNCWINSRHQRNSSLKCWVSQLVAVTLNPKLPVRWGNHPGCDRHRETRVQQLSLPPRRLSQQLLTRLKVSPPHTKTPDTN